jgi:hypothetical protein
MATVVVHWSITKIWSLNREIYLVKEMPSVTPHPSSLVLGIGGSEDGTRFHRVEVLLNSTRDKF